MTWVATAIIGGAVISTIGSAIASHNASNAATSAAAVQADAANQASQLQYQMYGTTRNDLAPFRGVGAGTIGNINSLLPGGLNSPPTIGPDGQPVAGTGGAQPGAGSSPFLGAVGSTLPQMGPLTQAGLNTFLPGSGSNPLQSALYSFVNGASNNPNPLLSAANNSIIGGSGSPNAALSNLTSYIPGGSGANSTLGGVNIALGGINSALSGANNSLGVYNSLLGLGPSPFAASQLKGINDSFNSDAQKWLKDNPGKTDADWAATPQAQGYNDKLIKFYQNNPDQVSQGIEQAKSQLGDSNYGSDAKARLDALQKIAPMTPQQAASNALSQTPGYQFALDQGLKATQNGFAAQGLASSGAAMKGGAQFAEGLASQTYNQQLQNYLANYNAAIAGVGANVNAAGANLNNYNSQTGNAYNVYNGTTTNALNAYTNQANLAGTSYGQGFTNALNAYQQQFNNANTAYTGQTNVAQNLLNTGSNAAAQTGTIGQNTASTAGSYLTSGAAATAGGIVGSANAVNNGLISASNNLGGVATLYGLNPSLFSGSGGGGNALGFQGYNNPVVNT